MFLMRAGLRLVRRAQSPPVLRRRRICIAEVPARHPGLIVADGAASTPDASIPDQRIRLMPDLLSVRRAGSCARRWDPSDCRRARRARRRLDRSDSRGAVAPASAVNDRLRNGDRLRGHSSASRPVGGERQPTSADYPGARVLGQARSRIAWHGVSDVF